jgi:TonB family protein
MPSTPKVKPRELSAPAQDFRVGLPRATTREEKLAGWLSLLPGLGQIYNGENGKGLLFLGVTLTNIGFCCLLIFPNHVTGFLGGVAQSLGIHPMWNLKAAAEIAHEGAPALFIYVACLALFAVYAYRDARSKALRRLRGAQYPKYQLTMSEATSGSFLGHYLLLVLSMALIVFFVAPPGPVHQVTDIELVPPAPEPPPPKPKQPDPPKKEEPIKIKQPKQEPKKPEPPKPTPVAIAVKTDTPTPDPVVQSDTPAPPAPEATSDTAPTGSGGGGAGDGGGSGDGVDFGPYLAEMQRRIKRAWFPPKGNESKKIVLKFKIARNGSVSDIRLSRSSGLQIADEAAMTAIQNAGLPPLPAGTDDQVEIKFTFDYNVFNGSGGGATVR